MHAVVRGYAKLREGEALLAATRPFRLAAPRRPPPAPAGERGGSSLGGRSPIYAWTRPSLVRQERRRCEARPRSSLIAAWLERLPFPALPVPSVARPREPAVRCDIASASPA